MPRISGSKEEAAEIQSQAYRLGSLWETAWLLTAPSVPSQLCLASKAGFIPRAALVIWQWLLIACVFQRRWYSLQLHSHKVSLQTHTKKTLSFIWYHKQILTAFGSPESWHRRHKCYFYRYFFRWLYFLPGEIIYTVNLNIERWRSVMKQSLHTLSIMTELVSLPCHHT